MVATGSNNVQFLLAFGKVPLGAAASTYARFRLANGTEACTPVGTVPSGEVEDYRVEIRSVTPIGTTWATTRRPTTGTGPGNYNTLLNNNGPRHQIIPGLFMGALVDAEPDGQPNVPATGDDINPPNGPDDEDGVIVADLTLTQTLPANIRVNATNTTGTVATLCGFMDWNGDGDFLDAGETATAVVATGSNNVQFLLAFGNVPLGAAIATYARFRVANGTEACTPVGTVPERRSRGLSGVDQPARRDLRSGRQPRHRPGHGREELQHAVERQRTAAPHHPRPVYGRARLMPSPTASRT